MLWQKADHEHILCISGDHVRNAILPKASALSLAAARRKAVQGEHMSMPAFCSPFPSCPTSNGTVALGTSACTSFLSPFSIHLWT